jgi:predicted nucleic-acid-binding Zn-ribbon protein
MKKGYHCPKCGNLEALKILITTLNGKSISLLFASQSIVNKPQSELRCLECKHVGKAEEFRMKRHLHK